MLIAHPCPSHPYSVHRKVFEAQVLQELSMAQPLVITPSKDPDSSAHGLLHVPLHQASISSKVIVSVDTKTRH